MSEEKGRVVVGVIINSDKIAVIKRKIQQANLVWAFPGGMVEDGETEEAALRREIKTEIGLDVEVKGRITERTHPDTFVNISYFRCLPKTFTIKIGELEEIEAAEWVPAKEALGKFTSNVAPEIRDLLETL